MHLPSRINRLAGAAARRYAGIYLSSDDLFQEAMLAMLEASRSSPGITSIQLWNTARDRCRSLARREQLYRKRLEYIRTKASRENLPSSDAFDDLRQFIWSKLPAPLATALDRHYWGGLSIQELAMELKVSRGVVEYTLSMARRRLRDIMDSNNKL